MLTCSGDVSSRDSSPYNRKPVDFDLYAYVCAFSCMHYVRVCESVRFVFACAYLCSCMSGEYMCLCMCFLVYALCSCVCESVCFVFARAYLCSCMSGEYMCLCMCKFSGHVKSTYLKHVNTHVLVFLIQMCMFIYYLMLNISSFCLSHQPRAPPPNGHRLAITTVAAVAVVVII